MNHVDRVDRTFINALKKELDNRATIVIDFNDYRITSTVTGKYIRVDIISVLRRPKDEHSEIISFITWKLQDNPSMDSVHGKAKERWYLDK